MSTSAVVYKRGRVRAVLTTDSPASSYGIPVLRVCDGRTLLGDFGPADSLPSGLRAGVLVLRFLARGDAGAGHWGPDTPRARALAESFLPPTTATTGRGE